MFVLPHFLPTLLDDTRHGILPDASSNLPNLTGNSKRVFIKRVRRVFD